MARAKLDENQFVFKRHWYEAIKSIPESNRVSVLDAVCKYYFYNEIPKLSTIESIAFDFIKIEIDRDINKNKGIRHWNWKGGTTTEDRAQRNSIKYKKWRIDVFTRDQYTCQMCGIKGVKLNAHHIKSFTTYPKLRFEISNGLTLCEKCHRITHKKK